MKIFMLFFLAVVLHPVQSFSAEMDASGEGEGSGIPRRSPVDRPYTDKELIDAGVYSPITDDGKSGGATAGDPPVFSDTGGTASAGLMEYDPASPPFRPYAGRPYSPTAGFTGAAEPRRTRWDSDGSLSTTSTPSPHRRTRWDLTPEEAERYRAEVTARRITSEAERRKALEEAQAIAAERARFFAVREGLGLGKPSRGSTIKTKVSSSDPMAMRRVGRVSSTPFLVDDRATVHRVSPGILYIGASMYEVDSRNYVVTLITGSREALPYECSVSDFIRRKLGNIRRNREITEKYSRLRAERLAAARKRFAPALTAAAPVGPQ